MEETRVGQVQELLMDIFEDEPDEWTSPIHHMIAGSAAGVAEHCAVFPLDTIKTHLQSYRPVHGGSFTHTTRLILQQHGVTGLFRGVTVAALGAIPAHALYFASYEFCKQNLGANRPGYHPVAIATSGIISSLLNEAAMTPCDSVKQKLQLGRFPSVGACVKQTYKKYGILRGFYSGYTTVLVMNTPYVGIQVATYESLKTLLAGEDKNERNRTINHLLAGAGGGAIAGAATNPLDVSRTRLQTQTSEVAYRGVRSTLKKIWSEEGVRGLTRGMGTRMIYHSLSSGVTWMTYEFLKIVLHEGVR